MGAILCSLKGTGGFWCGVLRYFCEIRCWIDGGFYGLSLLELRTVDVLLSGLLILYKDGSFRDDIDFARLFNSSLSFDIDVSKIFSFLSNDIFFKEYL
jgi:hypothetical protein